MSELCTHCHRGRILNGECDVCCRKPPAPGGGSACVKWGCKSERLVWLKKDDDLSTYNGFLIAKLDGWYCPKCGGSYGNSNPPNTEALPEAGGSLEAEAVIKHQ